MKRRKIIDRPRNCYPYNVFYRGKVSDKPSANVICIKSCDLSVIFLLGMQHHYDF